MRIGAMERNITTLVTCPLISSGSEDVCLLHASGYRKMHMHVILQLSLLGLDVNIFFI